MASCKKVFKDMIKKVVLIICCCLLCFLPPIVEAKEETLGDLKAKYAAKLEEKQTNDAKSNDAKEAIEANKQAKLAAEKAISKAIQDKEEVQKEIDISNEKIISLTKESENVLLYLQQMQGQNAYVEYISGASTMTDFIMRVAVVEQVSLHIQDMMKQLENEIDNNEKLKVSLEEKKQRLEVEKKSYERTIQAKTNDLASYDKFALDIDTQIKSLKVKLDDAKYRCNKYAFQKGDDAIINVDCLPPPPVIEDDNDTVISNGAWLKPLNSGVITSELGYRWGSYHNALDIGGNAEGTPVYAAAAGVVSGKIDRYSCGGNMLYIDVVVNGVSYTTYYYHLLKFNVNVGDIVTQNTIIGYVGGGRSTSSAYGGYDYCTTGAHLHFGVAKGFYNGYSISSSNVITPPGFPNRYGWRFYSRNQMG